MNKYLNPINYIKYSYKYIKKILKIRSIQKINNINFVVKKIKNINSVDELLDFHFKTYSDINHINREMFEYILKHFAGSSLNILETGSAAHGTKSSMLFASYVKIFGGKFDTVDTNPEIKNFYNFIDSPIATFHTDDSVNFIENLDDEIVATLDLIFLDSYDLDLENPEPSQQHGLKEFMLLNKKIKKGTIISIDDTPDDFNKFSYSKSNIFNFIPGKGKLVLDYIYKNPNLYKILFHDYSVVLMKK
tara:strand:- start:892 stop:1632 length:741 start_codon:yes stop_codon:yes gene_type:complete